MRYIQKALAATIILGLSSLAYAEPFTTTVAMESKGAATYYVPGQIEGMGDVELMVDTGSGYLTINEEALAVLKRKGSAEYVKDLIGVLADGSELRVPVYKLSALNIGGQCWLKGVEAAVFPGKTRFILGLSALAKAAPFIFSTNPPELALSNCSGTSTPAAAPRRSTASTGAIVKTAANTE